MATRPRAAAADEQCRSSESERDDAHRPSWCVHGTHRHVRPCPAAAAGAVAGAALRPPGTQVPGAHQLRRGALRRRDQRRFRRARGGRLGRRLPELRPAAPSGEPNRESAGDRARRTAGQPRAAQGAERGRAAGRVARDHQGGRDRGHDDAAATRARAQPDREEGADRSRALRRAAACRDRYRGSRDGRLARTLCFGDDEFETALARRFDRFDNVDTACDESACSRSRPARRANRRPPCTSTATCS